MKDTDDSLVLSETAQVDDAYWGGKKHDGVRERPMYMRLSSRQSDIR